MSPYSKQVANVYFNEDRSLFRADVEFHFEDPDRHPVIVPVMFNGNVGFTFAEISDRAYEQASTVLASITG